MCGHGLMEEADGVRMRLAAGIGTSILALEKASQSSPAPTAIHMPPGNKLRWRRCTIPQKTEAKPMEGTRKRAIKAKA